MFSPATLILFLVCVLQALECYCSFVIDGKEHENKDLEWFGCKDGKMQCQKRHTSCFNLTGTETGGKNRKVEYSACIKEEKCVPVENGLVKFDVGGNAGGDKYELNGSWTCCSEDLCNGDEQSTPTPITGAPPTKDSDGDEQSPSAESPTPATPTPATPTPATPTPATPTRAADSGTAQAIQASHAVGATVLASAALWFAICPV